MAGPDGSSSSGPVRFVSVTSFDDIGKTGRFSGIWFLGLWFARDVARSASERRRPGGLAGVRP